jgi:hypothetical protein
VRTKPNGCGLRSYRWIVQLSLFLAKFLAMVKPAGPDPTMANEWAFELKHL